MQIDVRVLNHLRELFCDNRVDVMNLLNGH